VKLLETAGKTIQQAAAAVVRKVSPTPPPARSRDPWYTDDERKAEINADTRWLGPRPSGWLR
jgi:hypothetical protein